jgi:hypothetical protein
MYILSLGTVEGWVEFGTSTKVRWTFVWISGKSTENSKKKVYGQLTLEGRT